MDIKSYIKNKKKLIDKFLDKYIPSIKTKPQIIHKAMRYTIFPGGKRIRPILTLASFEVCGGKGNRILPVACAIELIHTYTLIHDDLPCMDNAETRRGRLSCHKKFSEGVAVLTGDALLTLGFQLLSETGNIQIIKEISKAIGTLGTIGGQTEEIVKMTHHSASFRRDGSSLGFAQDRRVTGRDLDYIAIHKTGALFEAAVKVAGIFKGVNKRKIDELGNFGRYIGFSFQLIDDLIDRDGYVEIYGDGHIRKMTKLLVERAKRHLNIFRKEANRLLEIADFIFVC